MTPELFGADALSQIAGGRTLETTGNDTSFRVHVLSAAVELKTTGYGNCNKIKAISVVGDQTACRSLWALLCANFVSEMKFSPNCFDDIRKPLYVSNDSVHGYNVKQHHLGYNLYHLVALSADECFLPRVTYGEVFSMLKTDRFTVPLLKSWAPFIAGKLRDQKKLTPFTCFNCGCGEMTANDKDIEKIVRQGLKDGEITIA